MDKRYLLILIIILVCCVNLSFIVNNSNEIGSASVSAGRYLFTIPSGFNVQENNGNSVFIQNDDNNIQIYIESDIGKIDDYDKRLNYIENNSDEKILSKGELKIDNIIVNTVNSEAKNHDNKSAYYFEKNNTLFKIVISNFNYDSERELTLDYAKTIIQSAHFDYKSE